MFKFGLTSVLALLMMSVTSKLIANRSLVICGPSGVGKGTLISSLLNHHPNELALSVSHTTRKPRPAEVDGVHYHFIDVQTMRQMISQQAFIEHATVHGNLYGTSREAIDRVHARNKICILDVDAEGVREIKRHNFPAKYVFVAPPSIQALETRLRGRATEVEAQMRLRLDNARAELSYGTPDNFDMILVNDRLDEAVGRLRANLTEWFPMVFPPRTTQEEQQQQQQQRLV